MQSDESIGKIEWTDLTVDDAERVRDFYAAVVGWKPQPVAMGDYSDYNMTNPATGTPATGICHRRGGNSDLPAQWLIYVRVADLDASMDACRSGGGKIIAGPKNMGAEMRYCIIQDPAGAVCSIFWKRE